MSGVVRLSHLVFNPLRPGKLSSQLPLVILHGLFGSKRNWESLSKAFSRSGLKVVTVDARNHGESPHTDVMDYKSMSADIAQLLSDLDLQRVNILGHSMGGKTAMTLALTQPELVDKLIVEDIAPTVSVSTGIPEAVAAMKSISFTDKSLTSIARARQLANELLMKNFPDKPTRDFILTNIVKKGTYFEWRLNLNAIGNGLKNIINFPRFETSFDGKSLFLGGSCSMQISEQAYPEIYRLFPSARIQHIDGAGHWVHAEKPHQFLTAVESFLSSASDS